MVMLELPFDQSWLVLLLHCMLLAPDVASGLGRYLESLPQDDSPCSCWPAMAVPAVTYVPDISRSPCPFAFVNYCRLVKRFPTHFCSCSASRCVLVLRRLQAKHTSILGHPPSCGSLSPRAQGHHHYKSRVFSGQSELPTRWSTSVVHPVNFHPSARVTIRPIMSPAALPTPSTVSKETLPSTLPTRPMLVRGGPTNEKNQQQHRAARDDFVAVDGAKPYSYTFPVSHTALLMIDMQRDFLLPGGFGEIEGGEDSLKAVQACIEPARRLLEACRAAGLAVFHTREGHVPDLADCPTSKLVRQGATGVGSSSESQHATARKSIGDSARMGRLLVRGEYGHDFIDKLAPLPGEVVVDKPGKGAFWGTELMRVLKLRGATHLLVAGVTTECCVTTTFREANDRGFECCMCIREGSPSSIRCS